MVLTKAQKALESKWRKVLEEERDRHDPSIDTHRYIQAQLDKKVVVVRYQYELVVENAKAHWLERIGVIECGDRLSGKTEVFILYLAKDGDARCHLVKTRAICEYLVGGPRGIYWPKSVFVGTGQLMGKMAHAIRRGDPWKGRGS